MLTAGASDLVVDDFNDDGKMDVFVANDQTANFLWMQHDAKDGHPMFVDEAVSLGTAFDRDGFPQACMGVASGDLNGDGRTDLYLTNFQDESNTLYLSQSRGGFEDRTRDAELRDPSFPYLGFGTQFVDADLDGRLDLIVLNGHILDQSEIGRPAALRPQVFQQLAGGRFREMSAWSPTDFLGRPRIGRGLTLIDWNRDGLTDFAASYLDGTAGLGTNRTERPGRWLEIELAGVTTARDAIGAKVRFQFADGTERVARLTAGDGFAASNERVIRTGLGIADEDRRQSGRLRTHYRMAIRREGPAHRCPRQRAVAGGRRAAKPDQSPLRLCGAARYWEQKKHRATRGSRAVQNVAMESRCGRIHFDFSSHAKSVFPPSGTFTV